MTKEEFIEIFEEEEYEEYNFFESLLLLKKYTKKDVIEGAEHDIVYGPDIEELIENDISKEEVIQLRRFGWMVSENGEYLSHYV
jgi:choline kinase